VRDERGVRRGWARLQDDKAESNSLRLRIIRACLRCSLSLALTGPWAELLPPAAEVLPLAVWAAPPLEDDEALLLALLARARLERGLGSSSTS